MAKKKERERMECRWCGQIMVASEVCCDKHRQALAKEKVNLCAVCVKAFDTKEGLREHSHKEAA